MGDGERPSVYTSHLFIATPLPQTNISNFIFFNNQICMGNYSTDNREGRESHNDSRFLVLPNPIHSNPEPYKPFEKAMESKLMIWLINYILPSGYGLTILLNIDNVKGVILFVIAVLYGVARLFFYIIKQNQDRRMRELDIQERQKKLARTRNST